MPRWSFWGNKFGIDGTNMLFVEKVRDYQLLFTCMTSGNLIKDLITKISEKVQIWAILSPFWAVTPELEFC